MFNPIYFIILNIYLNHVIFKLISEKIDSMDISSDHRIIFLLFKNNKSQ